MFCPDRQGWMRRELFIMSLPGVLKKDKLLMTITIEEALLIVWDTLLWRRIRPFTLGA